MSDYTPTTGEVRNHYSAGRLALEPNDAARGGYLDAEFDRWLAPYERQAARIAELEGEVERLRRPAGIVEQCAELATESGMSYSETHALVMETAGLLEAGRERVRLAATVQRVRDIPMATVNAEMQSHDIDQSEGWNDALQTVRRALDEAQP